MIWLLNVRVGRLAQSNSFIQCQLFLGCCISISFRGFTPEYENHTWSFARR